MIWISLLSSTDCQTSLRTATLPTDPLTSMIPTAYLKLSGQIPSSSGTLPYVLMPENSPFHKQLQKLALYCRLHSENQLGNSKAYESNYNYTTAVIIKTLPAVYKPIQMYSCYMGNGKNTKAADSVTHNFSDCYITNSVTAIPVCDKMPKRVSFSVLSCKQLVPSSPPSNKNCNIFYNDVQYKIKLVSSKNQKNISWFSSAEIVARFGLDASYAWSPLSSVAIAESLCCSSGSPGRILVTVWRSDSICSSVSLSSLSSTICRPKNNLLLSLNLYFLPQLQAGGLN